MEDPGWGEYVPLPDEADGSQSSPTGGAGSGSQPPADSRPWWRSNIVLIVAALVVLGIAGGIAVALSSSRGPGPDTGRRPTDVITTPRGLTVTDVPGSTSPVSPPASTGGSSSDVFAVFAAHANAICDQFKPKLLTDLRSRSPSLLQDTKDLINALTQLGSSPSSASSWQVGLQDWRQAVSFLADLGDPQDWQINIWAGAHEFRDMGIQVCGSYGSIGQ